ncbi:MAG TPA: PAS domain-containing protein, partial [Methanothrix sp.]|nr:PAS domain-containing protein [Methanothrix sp.]
MLLLISFAFGTVLFINDQDATTAFTDIGSVIIDGLVTLALFYGAKCSYIEGRTVYLAWMMMALSRLSFTIGDGIWAYTELVLHESPFPSLADYFYILSYPLFLFGILILPSIKFTSSERLKMVLDTGIVMISAVLVFWSLIIAPTIQDSADVDVLTLMLSVAYPVMDLILLFAVLELIFKRIYRRDQNSLLFLAGGITSLIVADAFFFQQTLEGTYVSGGFLDFVWPVGYVLIGLAGMSQVDAIHKGSFASYQTDQPKYGQLTWPLYLPYFCAAGAFTLLVWSHEHSIGLSFDTLSWAVGWIIGLVIVRQVLALNENAQLYRSAQQDLLERKLAQQEIIRLNEELEGRVASRTAQLEAANRELQNEIQERTLAEAAMVDSERRLADIINFLPDATFVINKDGVVIAWNRAIEKLTGINAEDMLGRDNYEYALPFYKRRRPLLIDLVLKPNLQFEETYATIKREEDGTLVGDAFIPDINGRAIYL